MQEHRRLALVLVVTATLWTTSTVLASYALGRRIVFDDAVAGVTTRYYYDGQSLIEERDAADVRVRYHVNGPQYIDERIATFTDATGQFSYYLTEGNFSVGGMGNADGSAIERLDYSPGGDFTPGTPGAPSFYHDADDDDDVDIVDFLNLQVCFGETDAACRAAHDLDRNGMQDGQIGLADYQQFFDCFDGPFVTPSQDCGRPALLATLPPSGTFALHGRPMDVLSDGHALLDFRARSYDPIVGRFLQRDPLRYLDGNILYSLESRCT